MRTSGFHGRREELAMLEKELAAVASGVRGILVVEGEAGIGKTRLAAEAALLAERKGFHTFFGRGEEVGARPFGLFAEAFACVAGSSDPARAEIATLIAGGGEAHDPGLQYRVIDRFVDLVEREALGCPVMLVLDDLQWADASSLVTLRSAVHRLAGVPLLIVGLCRPFPRRRELDRVLDAVTREGGRQIMLPPLTQADVNGLVRDAIGSEPGPRLAHLVAGGAGNPLFISELLAVLSAEDAIAVEEDLAEVREATLPARLRATLLRRIGYLSESTLELLRLGAVLGGSFRPSELASVTGRSALELMEPLDDARRAGILIDDEQTLRFRHDLIREVIHADLGLGLGMELHMEAARRLAAAGAPALRVAEQYSLGCLPGDLEAVGWLRRAAATTVSNDPAAAIELLERAIELALEAETQEELATQLATFHAYGGDPARAERLAREVLSSPRTASAEARARPALVHALFVQGRWADVVEVVEQACRQPETDDTTRARLLSESALARIWTGDPEGAAEDANEAVRLGEVTDDAVAVAFGLGHLSVVADLRGNLEEGVTLARRALKVAEGGSPEAERRHPHVALGMALVAADRLREATAALAEGRRFGERAGTVWDLPLYHAMLALPLYYLGEWDECFATAEASLSLADETGVGVGNVTALSLLADIAVHRGEIASAERLLAGADSILRARGPQWGEIWLTLARAHLSAARGDPKAAVGFLRDRWEAASTGDQIEDTLRVGPWLARMTADAELRAAVAETVEAAAARARVPYASGAATGCRGLAEDDPDSLLEAIGHYRAGERVPDVAAACEDAASALARRGRHDEARPLFEEASTSFERLGAVRDAARVAAAMRVAGIRRGARGARARPSSGWEALTRAELGVARLVAEGLTNPEIAERLFISRATVKTHIAHIFSKLDVSSRRALAAEAARHDAEPPPVSH